MKIRGTVIVLCLLTLCLGGCAGSNSTAPQEGTDSAGANPLAGQTIEPFQAADLDGNQVTEAIFENYDLTMINIWGTFCGPCINEMPEIERLRADYVDQGVNIMGIVVDKDESAAREILSGSGAQHLNIIPDEVLEKQLTGAFSYVPVTIFVDSRGIVLDELVSGSNNYEGYKKVIEEIRSRL